MKGEYVGISVTPAGSREAATRWRIAVSRKLVPLATERNRWKRRIREILRKKGGLMQPGYKGVLYVWRVGGSSPKQGMLETEVLYLLRGAGVLGTED